MSTCTSEKYENSRLLIFRAKKVCERWLCVQDKSECEKGSRFLSSRGVKILALVPFVPVLEEGDNRDGEHSKKHHKLVLDARLNIACCFRACSALDGDLVEGHAIKQKVKCGNSWIDNTHSIEPDVKVDPLLNSKYRKDLGDKCDAEDSHHAVVFNRVCQTPIVTRR